MSIPRRTLLVLTGAACVSACLNYSAQTATGEDDLRELEARLGGGRLGVFALSLETGRTLAYRAGERFAMSSTFKWALAASVLEICDRGQASLADKLAYTEPDLLPYAPVLKDRLVQVDGGRALGSISLEDLCAAVVITSDNAAANLLLTRVTSPAGVTSFFQRLGDKMSRLDRLEPYLNENVPGDERDTTTPEAMARSLARVMTDSVLDPSSRDRLAIWLERSTTGLSRLRAGLPQSWRAGDKTGTGSNGSNNDVAIVWPPGQAPLVLACFQSEGAATSAERERVHADVADIAVQNLV
jgi:beta-lactamase class A